MCFNQVTVGGAAALWFAVCLRAVARSVGVGFKMTWKVFPHINKSVPSGNRPVSEEVAAPARSVLLF